MGFLALLLLPKCSTDLNYGPCPPARDFVSRVSGLVWVNLRDLWQNVIYFRFPTPSFPFRRMIGLDNKWTLFQKAQHPKPFTPCFFFVYFQSFSLHSVSSMFLFCFLFPLGLELSLQVYFLLEFFFDAKLFRQWNSMFSHTHSIYFSLGIVRDIVPLFIHTKTDERKKWKSCPGRIGMDFQLVIVN